MQAQERRDRQKVIERSDYSGNDNVKETKADLARRFDALNLKCDVPKFNSEPEDRQQHDDGKIEFLFFKNLKFIFSQTAYSWKIGHACRQDARRA